MKKTYVKPQVYFEDFQLSASIAGDCIGDNKIPLNHSKEVCTYKEGGMTYFIATEICSLTPEPEGGCYNGFVENFFAS